MCWCTRSESKPDFESLRQLRFSEDGRNLDGESLSVAWSLGRRTVNGRRSATDDRRANDEPRFFACYHRNTSQPHAHSFYWRHFWTSWTEHRQRPPARPGERSRHRSRDRERRKLRRRLRHHRALAEDLFELGIDVITTGNHIWDKREIIDYFQMADGNQHSPARRLLRPANYAPICRAGACTKAAKMAFLTR